ncbi:MAG: hypothetical protein LBL19_03905 [Spirochaetaceae bacterium]|nr:hypothetical protein [Spirochaetaceae bacterium]
MTVSQKASLSLLISVILSAGFTILAYAGLFDLVETRFYNPSVSRALSKETAGDAEIVRNFVTELQGRFFGTLENEAVRRSFLAEQPPEDIFERSRLYGVLLESVQGLQSVRFVDSGGTRIHYSTNPQDIRQQDPQSITYRNYPDIPGFIPYDQVKIPGRGLPKLTVDEEGDRLIFSFPFYDAYAAHRGTALFSLSVRAIEERLIRLGRIKPGEDVSLVAAPSGMVVGLPPGGKNVLLPLVAALWNEGASNLATLNSPNSGTALALFSEKTAQGFFLGRLVDEAVFVFPPGMKIILLASFFITAYLSVFLLFNLKQDPLTVVQNRLKQLQINLIEEYYDAKGDIDWGRWKRELEQRREEIRGELKRGIKLAPGKLSEDIDFLIDKSWDELLAVLGGRSETKMALIDEVKLQNMISRVILASSAGGAGNFSPILAAVGLPVSVPAAPFQGLSPQGKPETGETGEETGQQKKSEKTQMAAPAARKEVQCMENDEPDELEELESLEELEEFEELEELGSGEMAQEEVFDRDSIIPAKNINELASEIEFEFHPESEDEAAPDEGALHSGVEVVSPFATMLSDFSDAGETADSGPEEEEKKKLILQNEGKLEDLHADYHYSCFYRPFLLESACAPEVLEAAGEETEAPELIDLAVEPANGEGPVVLEERDGILYISERILNPRPNTETEKTQDPDFKKLLDSIISKK